MFFSHSATAWSVIQCLTFKVLHSFDSQFQGGVFIAHKNGLWVLLKGRHCPHVIHTFLYGFVQSKRLVCSGDENHDLRTDWKPRNNSASSEVNWWPLFLIFRHSSKNTNTKARGWHWARLPTSLASMTVPTPTVSAMVGTFERSPSKNRALAMMVSFASVFTLVLDTRLEPGSLNAMWPSGPIPDTEKEEGA